MKKSILLSAMIAFALVLGSCNKNKVKPSSTITTESRNITGFTALDVSGALDVEVVFSTTEGVVVEANSNLHQYILTDVVGGRLKIRMKNNVHIKGNATIKIYVSALVLNGLDISGASRVEFTNALNTSFLNLNVSGASNFQGEMQLTDLNAELSGASSVEIWGASANATMDLSGASSIKDQAFVLNDLNIELSGASNATLTVNGIMNIVISGASSFDYYGMGLISNLQSSGASSVTKH